MSDAATIWGGLFCFYILLGIIPLSMANNGERPKDAMPGSARLRQWEQGDAKGQKWLVIWGVGFVVLVGAWWVLA